MNIKVQSFLYTILNTRLSTSSSEWLDKQISLLSLLTDENNFYSAFSSAVRYAKKKPLQLSQEERQYLNTLEGFGNQEGELDITSWSTDELLRVFLVSQLYTSNYQNQSASYAYNRILNNLIDTADNRERIAYYKGLSLYSNLNSHYERVRIGLRSNINAVFDAIALNNPYPGIHLKEDAWNQMILKALFIGSPLHHIQYLDKRANPKLKHMLLEYANERRLAGRRIYPSLWRCVGPFANEEELQNLKVAYQSDDSNERKGAGLALLSSSEPTAKKILSTNSLLEKELLNKTITWNTIKWENLYYD